VSARASWLPVNLSHTPAERTRATAPIQSSDAATVAVVYEYDPWSPLALIFVILLYKSFPARRQGRHRRHHHPESEMRKVRRGRLHEKRHLMRDKAFRFQYSLTCSMLFSSPGTWILSKSVALSEQVVAAGSFLTLNPLSSENVWRATHAVPARTSSRSHALEGTSLPEANRARSRQVVSESAIVTLARRFPFDRGTPLLQLGHELV
jgi:hypothetical protein